MKIVINDCYGGYSLSPLAIKELAKIKGKECYFFEARLGSKEYKQITLEEAGKTFLFFSYSVSNPQDYNLDERDEDGSYKSASEREEKIKLPSDPEDRTDKDLINVIEKLGKKANSRFSKLKIIEIPDDVEWEIEEYDGLEHIAEKHRTWR